MGNGSYGEWGRNDTPSHDMNKEFYLAKVEGKKHKGNKILLYDSH